MRCQPYKARRAGNFGEGQRDGQVKRAFKPLVHYMPPRTRLASYDVPQFGNSLEDDMRLTNSDLVALSPFELAVERAALFEGVCEARRKAQRFGIRTIVVVRNGYIPFETWAQDRLRMIARLTRG